MSLSPYSEQYQQHLAEQQTQPQQMPPQQMHQHQHQQPQPPAVAATRASVPQRERGGGTGQAPPRPMQRQPHQQHQRPQAMATDPRQRQAVVAAAVVTALQTGGGDAGDRFAALIKRRTGSEVKAVAAVAAVAPAQSATAAFEQQRAVRSDNFSIWSADSDSSRKPDKWSNKTYDQMVMDKLLQTNTRRARKTPAHFELGRSLGSLLSPELASPEVWSPDPVPAKPAQSVQQQTQQALQRKTATEVKRSAEPPSEPLQKEVAMRKRERIPDNAMGSTPQHGTRNDAKLPKIPRKARKPDSGGSTQHRPSVDNRTARQSQQDRSRDDRDSRRRLSSSNSRQTSSRFERDWGRDGERGRERGRELGRERGSDRGIDRGSGGVRSRRDAAPGGRRRPASSADTAVDLVSSSDEEKEEAKEQQPQAKEANSSDVHCDVCDRNISISGWTAHMQSKQHQNGGQGDGLHTKSGKRKAAKERQKQRRVDGLQPAEGRPTSAVVSSSDEAKEQRPRGQLPDKHCDVCDRDIAGNNCPAHVQGKQHQNGGKAVQSLRDQVRDKFRFRKHEAPKVAEAIKNAKAAMALGIYDDPKGKTGAVQWCLWGLSALQGVRELYEENELHEVSELYWANAGLHAIMAHAREKQAVSGNAELLRATLVEQQAQTKEAEQRKSDISALRHQNGRLQAQVRASNSGINERALKAVNSRLQAQVSGGESRIAAQALSHVEAEGSARKQMIDMCVQNLSTAIGVTEDPAAGPWEAGMLGALGKRAGSKIIIRCSHEPDEFISSLLIEVAKRTRLSRKAFVIGKLDVKYESLGRAEAGIAPRNLEQSSLVHELWSTLREKLLSPSEGMFEKLDGSNFFVPRSFESEEETAIERLESVGQLMFKAVVELEHLPVDLAPCVFDFIVSETDSMRVQEDLRVLGCHADCDTEDKALAALRKLDENGCDTAEAFRKLLAGTDKSMIGSSLQGMCGFGSDTPIDASIESRCRAVCEFAHATVIGDRRLAFEALRRGFTFEGRLAYNLSPALRLFTGPEMVDLFCPKQFIELDDLLAMTKKGEAQVDNNEIGWLHAVLTSFSSNERMAFVRWCTGRDRLFEQITVTRLGEATEAHLPVAHACFNGLELPRYGSAADLKAKLLRAMQETTNELK